MNERTRTKHRIPAVTALLTLVAALVASVLVGPAPTASAAFSGVVGHPGPYAVSWDSADRQSMIAGWWIPEIDAQGTLTGRRTFTTNGVTASRSTASLNAQTVKATYQLQRWSSDVNSWVTMQEVTKQKRLPAYEDGISTTATLGSHWFDNPPTLAATTPYRVMYVVQWWDDVTGALLGYHDVYPELQNNFCVPGMGAPTCSVWNEDINW